MHTPHPAASGSIPNAYLVPLKGIWLPLNFLPPYAWKIIPLGEELLRRQEWLDLFRLSKVPAFGLRPVSCLQHWPYDGGVHLVLSMENSSFVYAYFLFAQSCSALRNRPTVLRLEAINCWESETVVSYQKWRMYPKDQMTE